MERHASPRRFAASVPTIVLGASALVLLQVAQGCSDANGGDGGGGTLNEAGVVLQHAEDLIEEGRATFRYDTFGSEDFWGGTLRLHETILGAANGGVGAA